jgi:hypothetical protein
VRTWGPGFVVVDEYLIHFRWPGRGGGRARRGGGWRRADGGRWSAAIYIVGGGGAARMRILFNYLLLHYPLFTLYLLRYCAYILRLLFSQIPYKRAPLAASHYSESYKVPYAYQYRTDNVTRTALRLLVPWWRPARGGAGGEQTYKDSIKKTEVPLTFINKSNAISGRGRRGCHHTFRMLPKVE